MTTMLKRGNHKLSSKIGVWTLPRSTCIGAGECAKWCYAKKMETMPNVMQSRLRRLEETKSPDFVTKMVTEIKKRKFDTIRIHESGDFYCQAYYNKWTEIAKQCPDVIFFTFTKTFGLLDFSDAPINFIILQSYGSNHDDKIDHSKNTARVIIDAKELRKTEYLCPYHNPNFDKCGTTCSYCFTNPQQVKHVCFLKH